MLTVLGAAALALLATACDRERAPAPVSHPEPQHPPIHVGPLTDYVPAAGLRWMIVAHPAELAAMADLREALEPLIDDERLRAFAEATGVDLRRTKSALVARFDYATLYMAQVPSGDAAARRFEERLASGARRVAVHPLITRATGVREGTPQTFVQVSGHLVAISVGDPTPARVVELFARRKLTRTVPALEGAALTKLPAELLAGAPIRVYFLGPFSETWARGARGLLSSALAAAIALWPNGGQLRARLVLAGEWEGEDGAQLLLAYQDLIESPLGRLLGLHRPAKEPELTVRESFLELEATYALRPVLSGLHAAVAAQLREMMDFSGEAFPAGDAGDLPAPLPDEIQ